MSTASAHVSFLIRLWRVSERGTADEWRATVEHVQSGAREEFSDVEALLAFLRRHAHQAPMLERAGAREGADSAEQRGGSIAGRADNQYPME
jgi:hypothetical protein